MDPIIIHVDMDAFYAAVETRDDPSLQGKALIIGSLPTERGVVATCSYEAREYGIRSGMSIKDAYRQCPNGIFMHPDFDKYRAVSQQLHEIWNTYATASEYRRIWRAPGASPGSSNSAHGTRCICPAAWGWPILRPRPRPPARRRSPTGISRSPLRRISWP